VEYEAALSQLKKVNRNGPDKATALCPAHADRNPSLSVTRGRNGSAIVKCFSGCDYRDVLQALGGGESHYPPKRSTPMHHKEKTVNLNGSGGERVLEGLTLEALAKAKGIPVNKLSSFGLTEFFYTGKTAVKIPYCNRNGEEEAARFRHSIRGPKKRFSWRKGSAPMLYGLERIGNSREVTIVEGESDCWTLWLHSFPALGVAGNSNWKEERDAHFFDDMVRIYVVIENGKSGKGTLRWLSDSKIKDKAFLIFLGEADDPSGYYLQAPAWFADNWTKAMDTAIPFSEWKEKEDNQEAVNLQEMAKVALKECESLAYSKDILLKLDQKIREVGFVGDTTLVRGIFLALCSRILKTPIHVLIKGPSSGSKSFTLKAALHFFREREDFIAFTAASEKALIHSTTSIANKFLVIHEGGYESELLSMIYRSLLSEGHIKYLVTEKDEKTGQSQTAEKVKDGPTGLVTTTTGSLHKENENRCVILNVDDSAKLTRDIISNALRVSQDHSLENMKVDFSLWHNLQTVLRVAPIDVNIPFAGVLDHEMKNSPVALRLRRDIHHIIAYIKVHAILHHKTRKVVGGVVEATLDDYAAIFPIVNAAISEGAGISTSERMIDTFETVKRLTLEKTGEGVTAAEVGRALGLDRNTANDRLRACKKKGLVENEARKFQDGKWVVNDADIPKSEFLPTPARLSEAVAGCVSGGVDSSNPSPSGFIETVPAHDDSLNFEQGEWLEHYKKEGYNHDEAFRKALTM
jgi:hypothetical protein